ncbi:MAG: type 1 glutamine amidotransferase [Flavobacteriia bacterium]|jgi:GMP synthase (glutamine-hydrolysing)
MIGIVDCGSQKVKYIEEAVDAHCDFVTIPMFDLPNTDLSKFDGIIISGAPILITEVDTLPYLNCFSWVKTYEKPIFGICFGHQMLGMIHGGFAARQKEDRDWQTIEQYEESPLFNKLPQEFEMMEDHCECISVPHDFILLAGSDACVNEAMQHKTKPFYGVQFHPEVSGNHGFLIIENFVNICFDKK